VALRYPQVHGFRPRHRYVRVGRREFHVAEAGDGPALLLLHDWPQHWYAWRLVIPPLAERHRILAMDLRGFGWSDIAWEGFDRETLAADAAGVLDRLDVERAFVAGHGWGGWVGQLLALRRPGLVARLVTLGAPTIPLRATPGAIAGLVRAQDVLLATPAAHLALRRRTYLDLALRRRSRLRRHLPAAERRRYWLDLRASTRVRAAMLAHRAWLTEDLRSLAAGAYRNERLRAPMLALRGERDRIVPARLVADGPAVAQDLRAETVPGAGHLLPEEAPELVARRAGDFFAAEG
jgi:pimeloyl-ACP methyl ester carboxylesterase